MTDEMLAVARDNQVRSGINNVELLKGHIEEIPLPDDTVDVIISNCVINLSADKDQVLKEAYRVLKPGGRIAVADIVLTKPLPPLVQRNLLAWAGCVAGALMIDEYRDKLISAGFKDVDLADVNLDSLLPELTPSEVQESSGSVVSAFIRAQK